MRWQRHHIEIEESILTVLCRNEYLQAGLDAVHETRELLKMVIDADPCFGETHAPYSVGPDAPILAHRMCAAGRRAGTGPMAAVAGAVAEACVDALIKAGADEAVADNGGDISLFIRRPVNIGLYAGAGLPPQLALHVKPREHRFGICTSSGTVGHSTSYGISDAATVLSEDILLADAAATALGNRVQSVDDLRNCFDPLSPISEVEGAMAICQGNVALWGCLPEFEKINFNPDLITRGRVPRKAEL